MSTDIKDYIVKSNTIPWKKLTEKGIDTRGISIKPLKYNFDQQRPTTFLLRFEPGASYPYHNHPAGEELFVMEGSCTIEENLFLAGDFLYTPPGFKHSVATETGCTILFMVPEEVEII